MSLKFAQSIYQVKNPEKYVGTKLPYCRSSWETTFCMFCDNNPSVQQWASEPVKIPYRDPLTGKPTVYVPDFLISYIEHGFDYIAQNEVAHNQFHNSCVITTK